jgi:CRP-like cAMP-binding protein
MLPFAPQRSGNILLNCLDNEAWEAVQPQLERCPLGTGQVLLKAAGPIEKVWFPEGGVASFHEIREDGSRVGVGIAGFEGVVGWSVLLGSNTSLHEATVAIGESTALCISASQLIALCQDQETLSRLLLRYVQCFVAQMGRTILANLHEPTERRLARWLLMNHDRFIRSVRGRVIIRDRLGLIEFAGESYGAAEREYGRAIMPFCRQFCEHSPAGAKHHGVVAEHKLS